MNLAATKDRALGDGAAQPLPAQRITFPMVLAFVLWFAVVVGATIQMTRYSNTPGQVEPALTTWPAESQIPLDAKKPTLVMFVHPHCPCTRASLGELERLLAEVPDHLSAHVVFLKPAGMAADWEKADLWRTASSIPGVSVFTDRDGMEARRFHAETSGQTMLYDPPGSLRFQGGITFARGHAGDNPGRTALKELVREGHSGQTKTPVFGCALFDAHCEKDVLCKR